jgi:hypothetical protein
MLGTAPRIHALVALRDAGQRLLVLIDPDRTLAVQLEKKILLAEAFVILQQLKQRVV